MGSHAIIHNPDVQRAVWFLGGLLHLRAGGAESGGRWGLVDHFVERGYCSPLHVHTRDDETFFVVEGTIRVVCGDAEYLVSAGGLAILPMGQPHAFVVTSPTARLLTLAEPAGFEDFVAELGTAPTGPGLPPASAEPPDSAALAATAVRYGIEIVGPPPAP